MKLKTFVFGMILLQSCLSVAIAEDAVNYRTLRFTLPVYEMKSKVTENELVSAIGAKSKNKQGYDVFHEIYYLIDPDTTFSDTSECIYNLMVKTEIPQWHGVTSDYGSDCIGCCKMGGAWFTIKDSITANHLFVRAEREHTFVLKLKYEECACVIDDWFRYLEDDHIYDKCNEIRLFIDAWPTTPEYPGGFRAINNFFEENMRYPEQARKQNIEGKVIVKFKIEKDGTITEAFVVRSPDSSLNEEAIRLVKCMSGKWIPAKSSGGKAIDSWFTIPVKFKLEEKL